ncbi:hypothetical protein tb265_19900 [Gemmatimonadetes bacterium T265]|nr:hypothetical protein tb265_19900 [Gemmatimonadetes bacterium T265]
MPVQVTAVVSAFMNGTLNWAVLMTGSSPATANTMLGDAASKSVDVETDDGGRLVFDFTMNAFPGTAWRLTLTKAGAAAPLYEQSGVTDQRGIGHDSGTVNFARIAA